MVQEIVKQPSVKVLKKIALFREQSLTNGHILQPLMFPKVKGITSWEELECLGYNPELSRVEAIVNIKKSGGYSGNMCSLGSPEYVRFFIDYNDGNGFEDLGLASFRAFNISEAPAGPQHPISYMVSKEINVSKKKKFCNTEVIATLRAVLSWNQIPSTNPNQTPTYGNILDAEVVLKPFQFSFPLPPIAIQPINPIISELIGKQSVEKVEKVDVSSFIKLNMKQGVSSSRTMTQLVAMSAESNSGELMKQLSAINLADFGIDLNDFTKGLDDKDFNVDFEAIESVGLNTAQDTLGAVINIKRPSGYGGNLCKKGSLEYVSFFADFNNDGVFDKYMGTSFVKVNDIQNIPQEGLKYAAFLKTDLSKYLKNCKTPQVVRIRAILSWATPPTSDPEQNVAWGNRMDALVQLRPRKSNQTATIYSIGNVDIPDIATDTCLAYPGNGNRTNNRPWGGRITIKGGIDNSGVPGTTKYRVEYSSDGVDYFPVTLRQQIRTIRNNPTEFTTHNLQEPNGWFPYLANHDTENLIEIRDNVLATWPSHDFEGKYYIRVSFTKGDPIADPASIQHSIPVRIQLDNRRFRPDNTPNNILDATFDVDMTIDGGVCKVYGQAASLTGHLKVRDRYYGGYDLNIQPATQIINSVGLITYATDAKLDNGVNGEQGPLDDTFEVDTSKLQPCGYTLRLRGYERTILNNSHHNPYADKYVGFCVRE